MSKLHENRQTAIFELPVAATGSSKVLFTCAERLMGLVQPVTKSIQFQLFFFSKTMNKGILVSKIIEFYKTKMEKTFFFLFFLASQEKTTN